MDVKLLNERVYYLQSGPIVPARQRYEFKQATKGNSLDHCQRFRFDSRRVLYAEEVFKELKLLHEELGHCNRDGFISACSGSLLRCGSQGSLIVGLSCPPAWRDWITSLVSASEDQWSIIPRRQGRSYVASSASLG